MRIYYNSDDEVEEEDDEHHAEALRPSSLREARRRSIEAEVAV